MGRHPTAVVGDEDAAQRTAARSAGRVERGGGGAAVPGVEPGNRQAGGPDPDLARRATAQRHPQHLDVPAEQVAQPCAVTVVSQRRDQHHVRGRHTCGKHRGQPGAAGPVPFR